MNNFITTVLQYLQDLVHHGGALMALGSRLAKTRITENWNERPELHVSLTPNLTSLL
jgi:hypothetical protein